MSDDMGATSSCPWSEREAELLAITLELLQEHGYDRLSVEAVATKAKASKATMYRRWPSKGDLVLAAFIEGTRSSAVPPHTGSLRGDLLEIGRSTCAQALEHTRTMRAVLNEMSHNPGLQAVMEQKFVAQRKVVIDGVLAEAVKRGEIDVSVINEEIFDLLSGYLVFRALVSDRPPTEETVRVLVDDVLLPSLTRTTG
ncbi:TetR/AcrR family transcriptional regulator [Mycobacterium sp. CBMA293]|uniref:TetR/AcrR family transcriptional regulator n=1 Tax=unclassified Mycolicibacterium TaxID=2636767 RepID=UPI0012DF14D4|nr:MULTISPECIES: TetR/AcrR family transcriptional regulator [unclassified Mycolicibacterium]MUL47074.1 TetR/AcrR family transcriptional regulator [Mycolicibacterium sp. CBMA 360]MUL58451.1 TetR/AcrR family transcriptional regulator [Mycolicibacterium sp. CBMA 335]MUL73909.1 TetR/AcrR family transcriptional regulator [Mycolicibacterium sp. CBMA 311]MUL93334.1 TetR/AcrR family transcriptional regulator [Mycolicibacterium sp. CBMA 230]MUM07881.1 TetR family transcriptional regulator [Mycolicibact